MELIVIDERRIKLMLSAKDMETYRITSVDGECIRDVMREVSVRCGYCGNALCGRIYVEMYPLKRGGCELFVTRLSDTKLGGERSGYGSMIKSGNEGILTEFRRAGVASAGRYIYSFETMEHLLGACRGLQRSGYAGESKAYRDLERQAYYLILEQESFVVSENLGTLCHGSFYYYINEHCRLFCADAITVLSPFSVIRSPEATGGQQTPCGLHRQNVSRQSCTN